MTTTKLHGYLGLTAAAAVATATLMPVSMPGSDWMAQELTLLDRTVLSRLMQIHDPATKDWVAASDRYRRCPPFQREERGVIEEPPRCRPTAPAFTGLVRRTAQTSPTLQSRLPNLEQLLGEHDALWQQETLQTKPAARTLEIELQMGTALAEHFAATRTTLQAKLYGLHAAVLALLAVMVWQRRRIGAAIAWPFAMLGRGARGAGRIASKVHEKI